MAPSRTGFNLHAGAKICKKETSPIFLPIRNWLAGAELKGAGCNEVFGGETRGSQPVPFKLKRELFIHVEYRMKLGKSFLTVQSS